LGDGINVGEKHQHWQNVSPKTLSQKKTERVWVRESMLVKNTNIGRKTPTLAEKFRCCWCFPGRCWYFHQQHLSSFTPLLVFSTNNT